MNKNFNDYDRVFAFGCSCTNYFWPTWADIIGKQAKEYYNYGRSGAGNLYISNSIVEANIRHNITENDLVLVMWTTISREDRYIKTDWVTPGNIYTQDTFSKEFVYKFADNRFYLMRDLGFIAMADTYIKKLNCDYKVFTMSPLVETQIKSGDVIIDDWHSDITKFYKSVIDELGPALNLTLFDTGLWPQTPIRGWGGQGQTADYHPTPAMYLDFIKKTFTDFNITEDMEKFANEYNDKVLQSKTLDDTREYWPEKRVQRL